MPIPKSHKKQRQRHVTKPDLDNLIKYALDVLNGVVIKDDCQVYEISARKEYSQTPSTRIQISHE